MFKILAFGSWRLPLQPQIAVTRRWLSVSETATALRPFFFAVHPDLFGQHPVERAVNEDSLKHLQQYLESLHKQRRVAPSQLTFYVRDTKERSKSVLGNNSLKKVQIELITVTVRDTVMTVLKSCDLSLDYINEVPQKKSGPDRPIKWDPTFYTFYGIPNPFAPRRQPKMDDSLSAWLDRNLTKARKNLNMVEPVRQQTSRMAAALKAETGLTAIHWDSSWGPAQFRACLLSLSRLRQQHQVELDLTGRTVVFTNETGVSLNGDILLRSDDVPDTWLRVMKSWEKQKDVLAELPQAEGELSRVLNNAQVVRLPKGPLILATEYLKQVRRLTSTVLRHLQEEKGVLREKDLSDISIVLKCATGSLSVSPQGHVLVPSSCPGFMIIDYLNQNTTRLRTNNKQNHRTWKEKTDLVNRVIEEFSLLSLSRDQNVTWPQMEQACSRLLDNPSAVGVSLEGCRLKVAQFYSVMSDGEIYIPWNWKGDS